MINLNILFLYIITIITYNSIPGPVLTLVTGTRLSNDFKRTVFTILGTTLGSLSLMFIAIFAILGIISINFNFLNFFKILGCTYLIYLSLKSINSVLKFLCKKNNHENIKIHMISGGFTRGYSVGVSNPKDIIFFASLFPQFLNVSTSHIYSVVILGLLWAIFDWVVQLSYAVIVTKIISKRFENTFILVASFFILIIAIIGIKEVVLYFMH